MATKRDKSTLDMFTGQVDAEIIPPNKALVPKPKKKTTPAPSVPSVPLPPEPTPLVAQEEPLAPAPVVPAPPDITLFPHSYLLVLGLACIAICITVADNLFDAGITTAFIKYRTHYSGRLDQHLMAALRLMASTIIAFFSICCGVHIAVRPTQLPLIRYLISGVFLASGILLAVLAYTCEIDYARIGFPEVLRRLQNIQAMKW